MTEETDVSISQHTQRKNQDITYLAHGVIIRDEGIDRLDREETLVHGAILRVGIEDIRRHDGRKVVNVHLATRLLVDMGER